MNKFLLIIVLFFTLTSFKEKEYTVERVIQNNQIHLDITFTSSDNSANDIVQLFQNKEGITVIYNQSELLLELSFSEQIEKEVIQHELFTQFQIKYQIN